MISKSHYSLKEAAKYLSTNLSGECTEDNVLFLGEKCRRHFCISIHCYVRKNFADNGGFYYPKNKNYSGLQSNLHLIQRGVGLKAGVVRGEHSEATSPVTRLLSADCKANLRNLRLGIKEEGFESFNREELCVMDFILERYVKLVKRWESINSKTRGEVDSKSNFETENSKTEEQLKTIPVKGKPETQKKRILEELKERKLQKEDLPYRLMKTIKEIIYEASDPHIEEGTTAKLMAKMGLSSSHNTQKK